MAQQKYYTILTEVGKSKIANATVLNEKVQFSKMQLGDGGGSQYEPHEKQTELKNKVWEGSISNVKVDENNPNWIVVETAIPGNSGGFTVREVGLFDDAGELLAVGKYPETYKPVVDDGCVKDLFVRVILMVVNTSAITLKIDPTVILASMKDLNDLRKEVSTKIDTAKTELNSKIDEVRRDLDSIELTAEKVSVKDTENNFTSVNTEGVLQELAVKNKSLDTKIVSTKSDLTNQFDHFTGEIDNLKQSVSSGKQLIATAVTGKDVPTNGSDSFQKMADNIDSIKTKLPILEGDVGVTEDVEGNVYGVSEIVERLVYSEEGVPFSSEWLYESGRTGSCSYKVVDGFIYLIFDGYRITKINLEGTVEWVHDISYGYFSRLHFYNDSIYILTKEINNTSNSNSFLSKVDLQGNEIWRKSTTWGYNGRIEDGFFYLSGSEYSKGNLHKYDLDGNKIWSYSAGVNSFVISDNYIYVFNTVSSSGKYSLTKLDLEGNQLWLKDTPYIGILRVYENKIITGSVDTGLKVFDLDYNYLQTIITRYGSIRDINEEYIFATISNALYKINWNSEILWSIPIDSLGILQFYNNGFYITSNKTDKYLFRDYDLDGNLKFSYPYRVYSILVVNSIIYLITSTNGSYYLSKHHLDGQLITYHSLSSTYTIFIMIEGHCYLMTSSGNIEKFKDNIQLRKVAILEERGGN
jgi:hypothetical protein